MFMAKTVAYSLVCRWRWSVLLFENLQRSFSREGNQKWHIDVHTFQQ